jgi:hypothetical protein
MPLNGDDKLVLIRQANRFDNTIRGYGLDLEPLAESVDALFMNGADNDLHRTGKSRKHAAGRETHGMGWSVTLLRRAPLCAVVELAWNVVQGLMESSSKGNVELLQPPA